ncbi:MAG: hypothetical protein VZR06_16655 [Butyrivibrio sp.]|nr:hypothetical protein [Butyrivibrio sp.]
MINIDIEALIKSGVDKDKLSADLKRLGEIVFHIQDLTEEQIDEAKAILKEYNDNGYNVYEESDKDFIDELRDWAMSRVKY